MKKLALLGAVILAASLFGAISANAVVRVNAGGGGGGGGGIGQIPVTDGGDGGYYRMDLGFTPRGGIQTDSMILPSNEKKENFNMPKYTLLLQQLVISIELGDAREIVKEEHLEQGIEISPEYMDSAVAAHFKVPVSVVEMANDIESYDEIPTVNLLITTVDPATQENLDTLRDNGYEVQGVFGHLVQVEVSLAELINSRIGLQTLDFVSHSALPLGMIEN